MRRVLHWLGVVDEDELQLLPAAVKADDMELSVIATEDSEEKATETELVSRARRPTVNAQIT